MPRMSQFVKGEKPKTRKEAYTEAVIELTRCILVLRSLGNISKRESLLKPAVVQVVLVLSL